MSELKVQNLRRTFGSVVALEDISFDVAEGEFFCLLGASSFGKTTILKQCDLKTAEWNQFYGSFLNEMKNTFIEELKKYERKSLDPKLTRNNHGKGQCTTNLKELMA